MHDAGLFTTVLAGNDDGSTGAVDIGHGPPFVMLVAQCKHTSNAATPAMIYKFKSPATGDVIMLAPHGDQLLRLLGRDPAAKGIIEPADMPAAIAALQAAVIAEEQPAAEEDGKPRPVALRQRVWPMVEMLKRSQAAGEAVTWGV